MAKAFKRRIRLLILCCRRFDKFKEAKKIENKSKGKGDKFNTLDDAFPSFFVFLADPMAISYFKNFLHSKVSMENVLFYEKIREFREIEQSQSNAENTRLCNSIFRDFFQPGATDYGTQLNVDSTLKRDISDSIKNTTACTSAIFKPALELILQQMQTEWHSFKGATQGRALLDNLNSNTYLVLPTPTSKPRVMLPVGWDASSDDPVNWGLAVN